MLNDDVSMTMSARSLRFSRRSRYSRMPSISRLPCCNGCGLRTDSYRLINTSLLASRNRMRVFTPRSSKWLSTADRSAK